MQKNVSRRRRKNGVLLTFFLIAFLIFVLLLSSSLFFKIKDIKVDGVSVVSEADVRELSGFSLGDNIFLINKASAAQTLKARFSYVKAVRIKRELPGKVTIVITETEPAAIVSHRGSHWLFDVHGSLLESVPANIPGNLPIVKGYELRDPVVGTKLYTDEDSGAKTEPMLDLLKAMRAGGILNEVGEIDLSKVSNITFKYKGMYSAELGSPEGFSRKIQVMLMALEDESVSSAGSGVFYLAEAESKKVSFVPE